MSEALSCPICTMTDLLESGDAHECATCGREWAKDPAVSQTPGDDEPIVKGSSVTLEAGTKIKGIRVVEGDHDVDCKVDGMGIMLKSEFLKKA